MQNNFLRYLCCPRCKNDLVKEAGYFFCEKCEKKYEIIEGIPVFIDLNNLSQHSNKQILYFNKEVKKDSLIFKLQPWQENYLRRFKENFKNVKNKLILDCGAGSGYMAIELAKDGAIVIACDIALNSLIRLKKIVDQLNLEDKICIVCCSAEKLPFKEKSFDYFILNAVLEHLVNESEAISQINIICKIKSGLMITSPLNYKYLFPLFIPINYWHDKKIGHLRRYDEKILKQKLNNFRLTETYYTGHVGKVIKTILNIFLKHLNEKKIELEDTKKENIKHWASNIICFFDK